MYSALGSVSHDVLHRATVPVVVMPHVAGQK
jgi:nucleotide-binding universal stress UspA family protein